MQPLPACDTATTVEEKIPTVVKIRPLTVADRDWLSDLIKKLVARLGADDILRYMVSDPDTEPADVQPEPVEAEPSREDKKYALLVIKIIEMMIEVMGTDIREWFASLVGVSVVDFEKLPMDTEFVIIEQLVELEESNRFFSRALALSSKIKGFVTALSGKKTP